MHSYGKIATGGTLASTGAVGAFGMPAAWTLAIGLGIAVLGAAAIRTRFRRERAISQR